MFRISRTSERFPASAGSCTVTSSSAARGGLSESGGTEAATGKRTSCRGSSMALHVPHWLSNTAKLRLGSTPLLRPHFPLAPPSRQTPCTRPVPSAPGLQTAARSGLERELFFFFFGFSKTESESNQASQTCWLPQVLLHCMHSSSPASESSQSSEVRAPGPEEGRGRALAVCAVPVQGVGRGRGRTWHVTCAPDAGMLKLITVALLLLALEHHAYFHLLASGLVGRGEMPLSLISSRLGSAGGGSGSSTVAVPSQGLIWGARAAFVGSPGTAESTVKMGGAATHCSGTGEERRGWPSAALCAGDDLAGSNPDTAAATAASLRNTPQERRPGIQQRVLLVSVGLRGHAIPLIRLADQLSIMPGLNVTFATHEVGLPWLRAGTNEQLVRSYSLGALPFLPDELESKLELIAQEQSVIKNIISLFTDVYARMMLPTFRLLLPIAQAETPDLIVVDMGTLGGAEVAQKLRIPYIYNNPTLMFRLEEASRSSSEAYFPAWGSGLHVGMSLWDRCMNVLFPRLLSVALTPTLMNVNKIRAQVGLEPHRTQHEVFSKVLVLVNTALGFEYAHRASPLAVFVGPLLPRPGRVLRPLPHVASRWLAGADMAGGDMQENQVSAVIYVSSGKLVSWPYHVAMSLVHGMSRADWRVYWTVSANDRSDTVPWPLPSNVRVKRIGACPNGSDGCDDAHFALMSHPLLRLVVSPCSMAVTQEALVHHIPVLCIPVMGDQMDIAARVTDARVGVALPAAYVDVNRVHATVEMLVAENSTLGKAVRENARRVGSILRRAGGTPRAARVVRAVLDVGVEHYVDPSDTVALGEGSASWHKTLFVDVLIFILSSFSLGVVAVHAVWSSCAAVRLNEVFSCSSRCYCAIFTVVNQSP